jgi:hypothetical protein
MQDTSFATVRHFQPSLIFAVRGRISGATTTNIVAEFLTLAYHLSYSEALFIGMQSAVATRRLCLIVTNTLIFSNF